MIILNNSKRGFKLIINKLINQHYNYSTFNNNNNNNNKQAQFGFLFDIDGVLIRGKQLVPYVKECFKLLTDNNGNFKVPTVFVTNASNELRSSKANKLSNFLGIKISAEQIIMSHSPLKIFKNFHNKHCLISGQGPILEIASSLGFNRLTTVDDLRQSFPNLDVVDHKRRITAPCVLGRYFPPIEVVLLLGEPVRWETSLQLILDVLMTNGRPNESFQETPYPHIPVIACNTDFVWMAEASMPRFGHGSFLYCLEQLYEKLTGNELKYKSLLGKPELITYIYSEHCIKQHAKYINLNTNIKRLYAIGDNIDTDVYGANLYNRILQSRHNSREKTLSVKSKKKLALMNSSKTVAAITDSNSNSSDDNEESDIEVQESDHEHVDDICLESIDCNINEYSAESINSILVCTGVYNKEVQKNINYGHKDMIVDSTLKQPKYICEDAYEAIKLVFQLEQYMS